MKRWRDMNHEERMLYLRRLKRRCVSSRSGNAVLFVCFNVDTPRWSNALVDQWIAREEASQPAGVTPPPTTTTTGEGEG